jgi:hypothetical protein
MWGWQFLCEKGVKQLFAEERNVMLFKLRESSLYVIKDGREVEDPTVISIPLLG